MAKTGETAAHLGETAAHLGAAERCGATSHQLRAPLGAWFAVATHRRLGARYEKGLPRRSVDGEGPRVSR